MYICKIVMAGNGICISLFPLCLKLTYWLGTSVFISCTSQKQACLYARGKAEVINKGLLLLGAALMHAKA